MTLVDDDDDACMAAAMSSEPSRELATAPSWRAIHDTMRASGATFACVQDVRDLFSHEIVLEEVLSYHVPLWTLYALFARAVRDRETRIESVDSRVRLMNAAIARKPVSTTPDRPRDTP